MCPFSLSEAPKECTCLRVLWAFAMPTEVTHFLLYTLCVCGAVDFSLLLSSVGLRLFVFIMNSLSYYEGRSPKKRFQHERR